MRALPTLIAILAALVEVSALATTPAVEAAREGLARFSANDCEGAMVRLRPLAEQDKPSLPDEAMWLRAIEAAAECDVRSRKLDTAYRYALKASEAGGSSNTIWGYRLAIEIDAGWLEPGLLTVQRLSLERPQVFGSFKPNTYWRLVEKANSAGRRDIRESVIAILATRYVSDDPFTSSSEMKLEYARILAGRGAVEAARAQLSGISADDLIAASFDPKLRDIVGSNLDIRQIAENDLAADRETMRRHPDRLIAVLRVAGSLRSVGKRDEALALLLSAKPRLEGPNAFTDLADETIWWWNSLAKSYLLLGNYDEMVRSFKEGAALAEGGGLNVSQVINLAWAQIELRRYREAIETLAVFDSPDRKLSAYGQLSLRTARACALALAGRAQEAAADVQFIRENQVNSPQSLGAVLLCLGDLDGSAREAIRLLGDDAHAAAMLMSFSDYETAVDGPPPSEITVRKEMLKARPDMREAIQKAGGARRLGIYRSNL